MIKRGRNAAAWALSATAALWAAGHAQADGVVYVPTLNTEGAKAIAAAALSYARAHDAPGAAVAVVDSAGVLLYLEKLDGTFQNAAEISIGKARTAALFGKPTRAFEDIVNKGRYSMLALPSVAPFTPLMGGVPIEINHRIAGAVGVSGAASATQDDEISTAAATQFVAQQATRAAQVTHIPATKVAEAFRADATLVTEPGYRVNASRRDGPGEAEVHRNDTDIFYVQQGTAELVTGGEVIGPHNLTPTEIRGSGIQGGDTRHLARGDVVTIPRGVPHWFRQVKAPFTYLVVKSSAP
jgi:glc operon protein GlcG